jgi:hypothetical protein
MEKIEKMIQHLENYGSITMKGKNITASITEVDGKEGYLYISDMHQSFSSSEEAIREILHRFNGVNNVVEWL